MKIIKQLSINGYKTLSGQEYNIELSYEVFGRELGEAPIILVNHALTGNSNICGLNGWWSNLIGPDKCIDTNYFCVLAFNVPGNEYGSSNNIITENYKGFVARDIAKLFSVGLDLLNIDALFAIIGGSVGGGIAWELASLRPELAEHLIPIACDWKATDWLISNCHIQDLILNHSQNPIADARIHAMTLYRTPASLAQKFNRSEKTNGCGIFNVESWLNHHGNKLEKRFNLSAYKMMNQVLKTIDITRNRDSFIDVASKIISDIHIITINSDLFFKSEENWSSYVDLKPKKENVWIHEIKSIHGHDAFLIEYDQLQRFLKPIFSGVNTVNTPLGKVEKCA